MRRFIIVLISAFIFSPFTYGQNGLTIKKAVGKINLDAQMEEIDWQEAAIATNFSQFFPNDSIHAKAQTEIRMTYDEDNLYIFAKMLNLGPREYVTPSLRRDFRGEANDVISVVLDTYADRNNAFLFGVNPFGVQREGLIANGGSVASSDTFSTSWDNVWHSKAKISDDFWTVEMAIPFKTLRYKKDLKNWYINFYRFDSAYSEQSTWTPIPRNQFIINLAFTQQLIWDQPLQKTKKNISLIPYSIFRNSKNFETDTPTRNDFDFGFDAKFGLGPAMTLDVTANPDFSQVEVDQQVTNLDRFEIFFPERRQFFLENADLFASFGIDGTRPFFSRRIGVTRDESTGQNIQNEIYGGIRLNGKLNKNLRLGVLNAQLKENEAIDLASTNYLVAALQQRILSRSYLSATFINKQAFVDSIGGGFTFFPNTYNRTLGIDANLASNDNTWNGKLFYHQSFEETNSNSNYAFGGFLNYSTYKLESNLTGQSIGAGYNPEVGFVRRRNVFQLTPQVWYNYYPKKSRIQKHGPGISGDLIKNNITLDDLDWNLGFNYRFNYKSTAYLELSAEKQYTFLLNSFDPSGLNGLALTEGTDYGYSFLSATYRSDARKVFSYNLSTQMGEYYNGSLYNFAGTLTYRYQPLGFTSLNFAYNNIRLPDPYKDADLLLIGTRFDFTFTKNIFWTTFVQFNSQIQNVNLNSRIQWRFKPVSDIFLVYTDNFFAESQTGSGGLILPSIRFPRQRAIVLKLNYWLNL